jgi:hypothetical protein
MQDTTTLIEAYERGDACQRLSLYLSYPHMRRIFDILERSQKIEEKPRKMQKNSWDIGKWRLFSSTSDCTRIILSRLRQAFGS